MSACHSYIKTCLGGPTPAEYEALLAERELLKKELSDARQRIEELQQQVCRIQRHMNSSSSTAIGVRYSAHQTLAQGGTALLVLPSHSSALQLSSALPLLCNSLLAWQGGHEGWYKLLFTSRTVFTVSASGARPCRQYMKSSTESLRRAGTGRMGPELI